ncbi:gliding motility protein RemB [Salinimicrobium tongyeongense]|uniref:Gliding motility protein RemB n=1 Tax=Salinimicrobium tongyeongense TaxID=2809707 RepID=A0ABY6NTP6_9FLAO|nr:gliding motility protein RemB [Salinimicrobium tongyeongense]UZH56286.1 gliding motility protein RemB [Salinimicrobium tongyeongense]
MTKFYPLLIFFLPFFAFSQDFKGDPERFPQFSECEAVAFEQEEACFTTTLKKKIRAQFRLPQIVAEDNYEGQVVVLFEVTSDGNFRINYINAAYPELKDEINRIFGTLPQISPATYNGRPIDMQFRMPVNIPVEAEAASEVIVEQEVEVVKAEIVGRQKDFALSREYGEIASLDFDHPRFESEINIPLSHEFYSRFEDEVNMVGTNFHSASKPFLFSEVKKYYSFEEELLGMQKSVNSWFERKLWNEHLFKFQGEDYWFTIDFGLDLQVGKDLDSELDVTYNNTRAAIIQGGLGRNFNFYSVVYENQGRFADYFNRYAESIRPGTEGAAIIPGRGIAKPFMGQAYDYPVAEGYLSFSPAKFINLQFGHGKNFIGDGYRSLLLSDNASPYPFFKLNTSFWKIKYTNTWMSLRDVRPEVTGEDSYRTKFMANHYLSYNVTKRLNIGFFESVMWENDNNRGFDLNYLNPVIFYRAIEFSTGAQAGNAIIGLTGKYKWNNSFLTYGQWLIDEFSSTDVFGGEGSWKNKHGFQVGAKYFNAFNIQDLHLQLEYNQVRPYTYSHNTITLNYGHANQSMAHLWGANFRELVAIARYKTGRYYAHVKAIYGERGFDFLENGAYYGGNIYRTEEDRPFETGVEIGQGNTTQSFFSQAEVGYIVNPVTNLKFFGSFIYRNFDPQVNTLNHFSNSNYWFNIGLRTDIFNWYFDM